MLKVLRKKGTMKKILWFVAIVIIISFGVLGQAYRLEKKATGGRYAGKIFGKKISLDEYQKNYQETSIQAMLQHGQNFYKIKQMLNLEAQTWDQIILLYEANRRRIRISDAQVVDAITHFSFFQRDGQFDKELYTYILQSFLRIQPRFFEETMRNSLKIVQVSKQETDSVTLSDDEIFDAYKMKNEKVQVSYAFFSADDYKSAVTFDENQAKDYYQNHKNDFLIAPTVDVEYIRIPAVKETKNSDADKTATAKTAETNAESSPAKTPEETAGQETAADKASRIATELTANPDFAKVAQANNLTVETTGLFSIEQPTLKAGWPFTLIQKIFEMNPGQIMDPIETADGYQILRIKEKKDAYIPDYDESKAKVKDAWLQTEAKKIAQQKAEDYLKVLQEEAAKVKKIDFTQLAKKSNVTLQQTPLFNRGQYLPAIGISKDFQDAAFSLSEEAPVSNVIDTTKGYAILHLDSQVPIDQKDFEKEKDSLGQTLLTEKKSNVFMNFLTRLRLQANLEDNISKTKDKEAGY